MRPPENPYLYPWAGPRLGTKITTPPRAEMVSLVEALPDITERVKHGIGKLLRESGYRTPTTECWATGLDMERVPDPIYHGATQLYYSFPKGPRPGAQIALMDAYWNRTYVSPDDLTHHPHHASRSTTTPGTPYAAALWLDLHTGHWCAFTGDTTLGGPLGDGYMHQSPATRYPQPGGTT